MNSGKNAYIGVLLVLGLAQAACSSSKASSGSGSPDSGAGGASVGSGGASGSGGGTSAGGSSTSSGGAGAAADAGTPAIHITAPQTGGTVSAATDPTFPDLPVSFTVENFTLKDPGSDACPVGKCGHVHLYVNAPGAPKTQCNDIEDTPHLPYNSAGSASPLNAGLDYCPTVPGARVITLELHNNDHSPVESGGSVVADSVTITVEAGDAGSGDAGDGG